MIRLITFSYLFLTIFDTSNCQPKPSEEKIIGGHVTEIIEVPHQVSVQYNDKHYCGGSIIGPKHILTAAHCVEYKDDDLFSVRAGSNHHDKNGQLVVVDEIKIHPNYTSYTQDYDAAVLILKNPLTFGEGVQIVNLATDEPEVRDMILVSGWGSMEGSNLTDFLQSVSVPVVSKTACNKMYGYDDATTDQMFCAGHPNGGKDSCDGDSGGPAVINGKLAGIVSWGGKCGDENKPSVYTNIPKILDWISAQIQE